MQGRLLLVAALLAVAGCGGTPTDTPVTSETVTPAPTPPTGEDLPTWTNAPDTVSENATIQGNFLARQHEQELIPHYGRRVGLRIENGSGVLLEYRGNLTVTEEVVRTSRRYRGPLSARFLPRTDGATSAAEQRYRTGNGTAVRQVVDGRVRVASQSYVSRFEPAFQPEDNYVAALLSAATIADHSQPRTYVATNEFEDAPAATTPVYLRDPRELVVHALITERGLIRSLRVTYTASLDGERVDVVQTVAWDQRPPAVSTPTWGTETGHRATR
ncbi:hypothetical protein BRC75_02870 [Halobacteriales archaeon QH_7_69_31]|nr:MAG: hypothetical protein BRC75_02870 [Halobacteriales archaeon QH_7_69_31]